MIEHEKLFAWLDGELDPAQAAAVEAAVKADPNLAHLADQHRALAQKLSAAFDPIAAAPVPARLEAALRPKANVVDLAARKEARRTQTLPPWTALAATLALGVFLGTMVPHGSGGPIKVEDGKIYATAVLNKALDTQLASAPSGDVRIGMTFRARAGEICRTFTQTSASGLACRSRDQWQIKGLFGAPEGQASDYRMAAGMNPNLATLVDATMASEPLDADQEKAEQQRRWR